jgi:NTP pyrophosphatase (non-canonical NTP hydrolase)
MSKGINSINHEQVEFFARSAEFTPPDTDYNLVDLYQEIAGNSAFYPGRGRPLGLAYVALKLNGEAGEFAEHVGKAMRDDAFMEEGKLTPERRKAIMKEIGDVLWYVQAACRELGVSMSDVMLQNLMKLADRTERNKLRGSGDDR